MKSSNFLLAILAAMLLTACQGGRNSHETVASAADPGADLGADPGPVISARQDDLPLLDPDPTASWSHHERFCEGGHQPDEAVIPQDPRERVLPGVSDGRAVTFNAFWEDCHQNIEVKRSRTCGEYRDRKQRGRLQATGSIPDSLYGDANTLFHVERADFENLWRVWGLPGRPDDFDQRLIQRYGMAEANFRNPYPLPGEDPNASDGGSGQLPLGLVQRKDAEGRYTGNLTTTCATCHSAQIGTPEDGEGLGGVMGVSPHNFDFAVQFTDFLAMKRAGGIPSSAMPFPLDLSSRRGSINAAGFSVIALSLVDLDTIEPGSPVPRFNLLSQSTGNTKTQSWTHTLHRMRSFYDGVHGIDNHRMNAVAFGGASQLTGPLAGIPFDMRANEEKYIETTTEYMNATRPVKYPRNIDMDMAKAGAVLFHTKDLWADGKLDDIPKPDMNGSCAGCHGVYSPRYAHDERFLADPELKGVTGYVAPLEVIGVDPTRAAMFTSEIRYGLTSSWIGYPEGVEGWVDPAEKSPAQELADDYPPGGMSTRPQGVCTWHQEVGYNTPSLYGVWANAPYLHNGSVPNIWELLKPEERPAMWQRKLTTNCAGEECGFDTSLDAYDHDKLGWKYDALYCEDGGTPYQSCEPEEPLPEPLENLVDLLMGFPANLPTSGVGGSGLDQITPSSRESVERRKIYNSHMYGSGNQGHDYGRALNDLERRAIIEYLKTL